MVEPATAFVATECDADSEAVLTVRAESNIALLILAEPLSPVALVKILTVTSSADVPPNLAVAPDPNRLIPLNLVSSFGKVEPEGSEILRYNLLYL